MSAADARQLRHLVALRWRMVRSNRARVGFVALAAALPVLLVAAAFVGAHLPRDRAFEVLLVVPTAYLSVAVLALVSPLVAGGGSELFPDEQLVAYPVTARTVHAASLLLMPLNLAWTIQLVGLVGVTAFVSSAGPGVMLSVATCLVYVAAVTLAGHALAWLVVGVRQRPRGRAATAIVAAVLAATAAVIWVAGGTGRLLDASPTTRVVVGALNGAAGSYADWSAVTLTLLVACALLLPLGRAACAWALRQPGEPTGRAESRQVRRPRAAGSVRRALVATDRASVWRSASLRRGLVVLGVLPGAVAAVAGLSWSSLVLLPGLVAAGAGLLFGVNVFCLDGPGAVWLASLPGTPSERFLSKARVTAEVCVVAVAIAVVAGVGRTATPPTATAVCALIGCAAACVTRVVATCMRLSVTRPHRADLRGPRDTPAPPGVMAVYSARLAASTTLVALLFSGLAELDDWRLPVLLTLAFLLVGARSLAGSHRRWRNAVTRAQVVTVVARG